MSPIVTTFGPTAPERSPRGVGGSAPGADVRILPPALFAAPFAVAAWLHRRRRWPRPSTDAARRGRAGRRAASAGVLRRVTGLALIGAGAALMGWSFATLRAHNTTVLPWAHVDQLVSDGPFALIRNPIYAADVLIYLGGTLLLRSAWPLLPLPAVLQLLRRQVIEPEEAYLAERFGTAYAQYCREVPRLVPRLVSRP